MQPLIDPAWSVSYNAASRLHSDQGIITSRVRESLHMHNHIHWAIRCVGICVTVMKGKIQRLFKVSSGFEAVRKSEAKIFRQGNSDVIKLMF